jgi:small-conductance mechanosensitive channel/CRP-like cAMP-binding protein
LRFAGWSWLETHSKAETVAIASHSMMLWSAFLAELRFLRVPELLGTVFVSFVLVRLMAPEYVRRLRSALGLIVIYLVLLPVCAYLHAQGARALGGTRGLALALGVVATIWALSTLILSLIARRLRVEVPRLLSDLIVAAASVVAVFVTASHAGVELAGLLTTSAVLTAVIGLSLQDTLGNMFAGITLQLDSSVRVGDWVKVGEISGRVTEIRWRYTAIETRNWETVIVPNAQLVKGQVVVQGRRQGEAEKWRRWVYFNVDFRYAPDAVINVVTAALCKEPIPRVANEPRPHCILIEIGESYYRFAVRYWLTEPGVDDPTDSVVRTRLIAALKRAGIPLGIPAKALFVTSDTSERREEKARREVTHRVQLLRRISLFDKLSTEEVERLATDLKPVPFAKGEVLTHQGAEAHWLYVIVSGNVSVRVAQDGIAREIAQLGSGQFFGEMGLLTGAPRTATVVALEEVECYRLDKGAFEELLRARPEIAQDVAAELASRRTHLMAVRDDLDAAAAREAEQASHQDLLAKMRSFFNLDLGS